MGDISAKCWLLDKWAGIGKEVKVEFTRTDKRKKLHRSKKYEKHRQWLQGTRYIVFNTYFQFSSLHVITLLFEDGWQTINSTPPDWLHHILSTLPPSTTELSAGRWAFLKLAADCKHKILYSSIILYNSSLSRWYCMMHKKILFCVCNSINFTKYPKTTGWSAASGSWQLHTHWDHFWWNASEWTSWRTWFKVMT